MAELDQIPFWQRPMGGMAIVGRDELGNPVYRNALSGASYMMQPPVAQNALAIANDPRGQRVPDVNPPQRSGTGATAAPPQWVNALTQGFTAPGQAARGEPMMNSDVLSTALDYGLAGAGMAAPENALRANSFRAFHGSPHTFDRFSTDAIGTGEGAQAYGHGLYFAENEDIARSYRDTLSQGAIRYDGQPGIRRGTAPDDVVVSAVTRYIANGNDPETAMRRAANDFAYSATKARVEGNAAWEQEYRALEQTARGLDVSKFDTNPGSMYEVQINADPASFLDWDAPLSQQPESVRSALGPLAQTAVDARHWTGISTGEDLYSGAVDGQMIQNNATGLVGEFNAKNQLSAEASRQGIPGISYLDAGSRSVGNGSRNFVVFDDKLIQIMRRYGIGTAVAGGGWSVSQDEYDSVLGGA